LEHAAFTHVRTQPLTLKGHIRAILAGAALTLSSCRPRSRITRSILSDHTLPARTFVAASVCSDRRWGVGAAKVGELSIVDRASAARSARLHAHNELLGIKNLPGTIFQISMER
jgi:hypothetical protein